MKKLVMVCVLGIAFAFLMAGCSSCPSCVRSRQVKTKPFAPAVTKALPVHVLKMARMPVYAAKTGLPVNAKAVNLLLKMLPAVAVRMPPPNNLS